MPAPTPAPTVDGSTWNRIVVRIGEIALKGGNRGSFMKRLRNNLQRVVNPLGGEVSLAFDHLVIEVPPDRIQEGLQAATRVFGVVNAAPVRVLPADADAIVEACLGYYRAQARPGASFGAKVKRSDKQFPVRSADMQCRIGDRIVEAEGAPVNLSRPDVPVRIRILEGQALLLGKPVRGPGGLPPRGKGAEVLTLFSGGIDSPVAAWHMMRRGCETDFVHVHVYPDGARAFETKIPKQIEALLRPQGLQGRLFLLPYHPFQMALLTHPVPPHLELILFRRHLFRTTSHLARKLFCKALVTGDNLSQVASQTLGNLLALEGAVDMPVFRPLLTLDKQEIIDRAIAIDTFDLSVESYKDCCSLVAGRPDTNPRLERVLQAEGKLPVEAITAETLAACEGWKFRNGTWEPMSLDTPRLADPR